MGVYGSGPYGYAGSKVGKPTTNSCLALDIRKFKRDNLLHPGISFTTTWTTTSGGSKKQSSIGITVSSSDLIVLKYTCTIDGEAKPVEDPITLDYSDCNYGNHRPWFRCPSCRNRVALLYQRGIYFRCRHCHNLTYYSCQEAGNLNNTTIRRVEKVLARLKSNKFCGFDILYYTPPRPRYMHRKTYRRLLERYDRKKMEYAASVRMKIQSFGSAERDMIDVPDWF